MSNVLGGLDSCALFDAYLGLLAGIALYNAVLGVALRERVFLMYAGFVVALTAHALPLAPLLTAFAAVAGLVFANAFVLDLLPLRRLAFRSSLVMTAALGVAAAAAVVQACVTTALPLAAVPLAFAIAAAIRGSYLCARFSIIGASWFCAALGILAFGVALAVVTQLSGLHSGGAIFSSALGLAAVVASVALSGRIRSDRVAKVLAERSNAHLRLMQDRLETLAMRDAMTGLFNRNAFEQFRAEPNQLRGWVVFADLDGLKEINDTRGHDAGDRAIVAAARALARCTTYGDQVFRLGGDEFVAILGPSPEIEVRAFLAAVQSEARREAAAAEPPLPRLAISGGFARFDRPDELPQALALADQRLYAQKPKRRGRPLLPEAERRMLHVAG